MKAGDEWRSLFGDDFAAGGSDASDRVPPALHRAWVGRLRWHFDFFNGYYLGGRLRAPLFRLSASQDRLGEWNGAARTISISERHILTHRWENVLDTLRHEMAHQYVEEVLGVKNASPHGEAFQDACWLLRIDGRRTAAAGALGSVEASPAGRDKILARIKDLLAMAGSPNEHEAANAMRLAHKYLLKYNLDLSELRSERRYETRCLGRTSARIQEYEYTLASILQDHFFVLCVWTHSYDPLKARRGSILEISGTPENLEIAAYVYDYVLSLTGPLWRAYQLSGKPGGGTRLQYLAGLLSGLAEKLDLQGKELKEEQGLIWLGDPGLKQHFEYLHPRLCTRGGYGVSRGDGFRAGRRDGREITIRRGVGGASESRGRLLPGGG